MIFFDGKKRSWVQPRDRPGLLSSEKKKDLGPTSEDIEEGRLSSGWGEKSLGLMKTSARTFVKCEKKKEKKKKDFGPNQ